MAFLVNWMQPASGDAAINVPASTFRMMPAALAGLGLEGIIAPGSAIVLQRAAGANFSVDIQPFQAIVAGNDVTDQGAYLVTNTAVFNLVTPTAPGSGTRTHRLVAQVRDKRSNATWSTYDWTPVIVSDTGSGEPAEPASSETLAHITIAAGQPNVANANISQGGTILRNLQIYGPWQSLQSGAGSWNNTGQWNDFSSGNWAPITFTVPPSGAVFITIGAGLTNVNGNNSIGWRVSGTDTFANTFTRAITASAVGTQRFSKRNLVTSMTPGGTNTVTPGWFQGTSGNSDTADGNLIVEAVQ